MGITMFGKVFITCLVLVMPGILLALLPEKKAIRVIGFIYIAVLCATLITSFLIFLWTN